MMTQALLQKQDALDHLSSAWLSLPVEKGTLLVRAGGKVMGLVLVVAFCGAIVWVCHLHKSRDGLLRWWALDTFDDPFQQVIIHAVESIRESIRILAVTLKPVGFVDSGLVDSEGKAPQGMVLVGKGAPQSMLRFVAQRGLHNLSVPHMRDLIKLAPLQLASSVPKLEHDLAVSCVSAILPELSAEDVALLARRHRVTKAPPSSLSTVLDSGGLKHVEGILEADDSIAIRAQIHQKEVSAAIEEGRLQALSKGPPKPRKLTGVPSWQCFTREQAQKFCPDVRGCRVDKDERLHFRWNVAYPCDSAPFFRTKVWHTSTSQRQALMHCLSWAWRQHFEHTGELCPYKLGEEL